MSRRQFTNLLEELRIRYAMWRYGLKKPRDYDLAETFHAIKSFRGMGDSVDIQHRIRQAAQLEAHDVRDGLFQLFCRIASSRKYTYEDMTVLWEDYGIKAWMTGLQDMRATADKIERLQHAVKQLARIAGPGFTTDHLIDEGLLQEGDL